MTDRMSDVDDGCLLPPLPAAILWRPSANGRVRKLKVRATPEPKMIRATRVTTLSTTHG